MAQDEAMETAERYVNDSPKGVKLVVVLWTRWIFLRVERRKISLSDFKITATQAMEIA